MKRNADLTLFGGTGVNGIAKSCVAELAEMQTTSWLARRPAGSRPALRLYCFPYAGGSGSAFLSWQQGLAANVEVVGIQMPGRDSRLREPPLTSMRELVDAIVRVLASQDARMPFAFFGHSLGAIVAFEVSRRCQQLRRAMPLALIASGSDAPRCRTVKEYLYTLADDELINRLNDYDGTPGEVLQNRELMAIALPYIRADFQIAAGYKYEGRQPLDIPIAVLAATGDRHVSRDEVYRWQEETTGRFDLNWFEGGHFFINTQRDAVLNCVNRTLATLPPLRSL